MTESAVGPQPRKRSWPLVALGATAFVPGLGLFLGAAAVTWGLLSDRPRARLAIWLGASGAFLQLVAGVGFTWWMSRSPEARHVQTVGVTRDLQRLVMELDAYRAKTGHYPATLLELVPRPIPIRVVPIYDQLAGPFSQQLYQYRPAADRRSFDLFSAGLDRTPGTADDIRPELPDSVLRVTGYRPSG
jgi:hypothetical protein